MSSDSSPPRASISGEDAQTQAARPGRLSSLNLRSFRLRYGNADTAPSRRSTDNRSPFGPESRGSLDRRSFHLRYADYTDDSDRLSSDDEDPDFTVSYSRTLPRESHNEAVAVASISASSGL